METPVCSVCLANNRRSVDIVNTYLHTFYKHITGLNFDFHSCCLCYICHKRLQQCFQFATAAVNAQNYLMSEQAQHEMHIKRNFCLVPLTVNREIDETYAPSDEQNSKKRLEDIITIKVEPHSEDSDSTQEFLEIEPEIHSESEMKERKEKMMKGSEDDGQSDDAQNTSTDGSGRKYQLDAFTREQIIALYTKGCSVTDICKRLKISRRTAYVWIRRYASAGNVKNKAGGPSNLYVDSDIHKGIIAAHTSSPSSPLEIIARRFDISVSTVYRHLKMEGFGRIKRKNRFQQIERMKFAQTYVDFPWTDSVVIFVDELCFKLDENSRKVVWRKTRETRQGYKESKVVLREGDPFALWYWGWMSSMGPGELVELTGPLTSTEYWDLLDNVMIPTVRIAYPNEHIYFVTDIRKGNSAQVVEEWVSRRTDVTLIDWPIESANLHLMEMLWNCIVFNWGFRKLSSVDDFKELVSFSWDSFRGSDYCFKLFSDMSQRLRTVIDRNGKIALHDLYTCVEDEKDQGFFAAFRASEDQMDDHDIIAFNLFNESDKTENGTPEGRKREEYRLDSQTKHQIVEMFEKGYTMADISRHLKISRKSTRTWIDRYNSTGTVENRKGGPKKHITEKHQAIMAEFNADPTISPKAIGEKLNIPAPTVRRHLKRAGFGKEVREKHLRSGIFGCE